MGGEKKIQGGEKNEKYVFYNKIIMFASPFTRKQSWGNNTPVCFPRTRENGVGPTWDLLLAQLVRKAQAAVRNARHKQFKARLVSSSSSAASGC